MHATTHDTWMLEATHQRDPSADGRFFYAVVTTGIFCYPSCAARPARPENLRFFTTREDATLAGYRPCRRCRPDLAPKPARLADSVAVACRAIDAGTFDLAATAAEAGIGRAQFDRVFRDIAGVSPAAYARHRRDRAARAALTEGMPITEAIYQAGFGSSGRFYEAADAMLGMTPTAWRDGGSGEHIAWATGQTSLGIVLAAHTARGICAILIGDDVPALQADLARRFPRAARTAAGPDFANHLAAVLQAVETPAIGLDLPLDIRGTAFQLRVWQALRRIPVGHTASYTEVAQAVGAPSASRAVAAACAANRLAIAIPCHRVLTASGGLSGYRWGVARKRALLAREQCPADKN